MKRQLLLSFFASVALNLIAAPPEIDPAKDLPRFPAVEPAKAVSTLQVKPGFRAELVASEPLIVDPITVCFDEHNRMFVVEMRDYSERREEKLGRIRMLEDTDGDGIYDKTTVYAEGNMPWPTSVCCYDGGIFVISTPDLLYFKDTDGDGKADVRKLIFTGFGNTKDRLNVQGLANGLQWGLDNRIHGLTAPNGGILTNIARPSDKPLDLNSRNFAFDPKTFELFPESGGGQYGMSYDTRGRKFTCSNSEHLMMWMYEARYGDRNPYYAMPKSLVSIAVDGGAAEVYRISPEEPWRVIRTKWRVSGIASGPVEGGGRASGYFTGATGLTIYRGNAYGPDFLDNAFTGDAGGNLVHRKKLYPNDVGLKGERPADEKHVEFLASKDTWFRPVHFANAPDGCLYVIDMYREVIEHPWSLPEQLKKHIDLNSGNDRGRIFRIVPDGFKQPTLPDLGKMDAIQLTAQLENPNAWQRETAARLLYERRESRAIPSLRKIAQSSKFPLARMQALYALEAVGGISLKDVCQALTDSDATVREHAIKLSERFRNDKKGVPFQVWQGLQKLTSDPTLTVIYQLAFTLGEIQHPDRTKALAECLQRDMGSEWMRAAVLSSLSEGAGEMFVLLSGNSAITSDPNGQKFLSDLAKVIGAKNESSEVGQVLSFIAEGKSGGAFSLVGALGEGLQNANSSLAAVDRAGNLKKIFLQASQVAGDSSEKVALRLQAVKLLSTSEDPKTSETLLKLLEINQPQELQTAAVSALGKIGGTDIAAELIRRWKTLTPRVRTEAIAVLVARKERAAELLKAIQDGAVSRNDIPATQVKFLKTHGDAGLRKIAIAVFAEATPHRQDVVDAFKSALDLKGDAQHGRAIYLERCSSCHRLEGQGFALGPDLVTVKNSGKDKLLLSVLDPNREVAAQFQAYEIETTDGESVMGLISDETATSVTLKQAYGKEDVIPRAKIKKMQSQNQSLMPEGLEQGLKPQDVADLMEFILTVH